MRSMCTSRLRLLCKRLLCGQVFISTVMFMVAKLGSGSLKKSPFAVLAVHSGEGKGISAMKNLASRIASDPSLLLMYATLFKQNKA